MDVTTSGNIPQPDERLFPATYAYSLEDIEDGIERNQVSVLQQLHPWASITLCHSMLVRCRVFADASTTLHKMAAREMEDPILEEQAAATAKFSASYSLNGSFGNSAETPSRTSTPPSAKHAKGQTKQEIESAWQKLMPSFKAVQKPGIFSRAERQRVITLIAASKETVTDRERASFVANAVIYRAFSTEFNQRYFPRHYVTTFPMTSGLFPHSPEKYIPSKFAYKGTNRGKFQPLSFNTPEDGTVVLQSISLAFPYLKTSFEELRLGDYIRGRKKAPPLFTPFPKLPAEIRCMIWKWAMPPRTVELRYSWSVDKCWTVAKVPVTLRVCRESRYEALKVYSLAFGIHPNASKIYFNFPTDTIFLTFEKSHGDGDYEDQVESLAYKLVANGEANKIRSLAIDRELLEILARFLEDAEEEWYDEGDEDEPMPVIDVIPVFPSLDSLIIVKPAIDGYWDHDSTGCDCCDKDCAIKKQGRKNDNAVFEAAHPSSVADKIQQEYYKQLIAQVKAQTPDWNVPELSYMVKRARPSKSAINASPNSCPCGGGCWEESD